MTLLAGACASLVPPPTAKEAIDQALVESSEIAPAFAREVPSWDEVVARGTVRDTWLKTFGDTRLEAIVNEALKNNRDLAAARANLDTAAGFARQALAALALVVAVDTRNIDRGSNHASPSGVSLNLQWELDLWGRLAATVVATEADLEGARQSLVAQIAKAWFLANEANLQLELASEAVEVSERISTIVETRVETGAGSQQEILLEKADLKAAKARLHQAIGALIQAVRSIEVMLGRYPSAELEVAQDFAPTPPAIPIGVPAKLLERRPDLIAAERRVAAAFQRIGAARTARLPGISLTTAGGSSSNELIDLLGVGNNFFSVGANFVAPLDIGGGQQTQVDIGTAQQEAALANYAGVAQRAFGEVEDALSNERLLAEREAFLAAALDTNQDALDQARAQYVLDQIDLLSVLQLQARTLNSRILLIRLKNARLVQRVDLHLALGGDFH